MTPFPGAETAPTPQLPAPASTPLNPETLKTIMNTWDDVDDVVQVIEAVSAAQVALAEAQHAPVSAVPATVAPAVTTRFCDVLVHLVWASLIGFVLWLAKCCLLPFQISLS